MGIQRDQDLNDLLDATQPSGKVSSCKPWALSSGLQGLIFGAIGSLWEHGESYGHSRPTPNPRSLHTRLVFNTVLEGSLNLCLAVQHTTPFSSYLWEMVWRLNVWEAMLHTILLTCVPVGMAGIFSGTLKSPLLLQDAYNPVEWILLA